MRWILLSIALAATALLPAASSASHSGPGGQNRDFAVGAGSNQFLIGLVGEAHLSISAHSGPAGEDPRGYIVAKGNPLGTELPGPFHVQGHVTCLQVVGKRAAIKYRFERATGSAAEFQGGGVQIFIEDNGEPQNGQPADAGAFDPPQPAGVFNTNANQCQVDNRAYDQFESGNVVVHEAGVE